VQSLPLHEIFMSSLEFDSGVKRLRMDGYGESGKTLQAGCGLGHVRYHVIIPLLVSEKIMSHYLRLILLRDIFQTPCNAWMSNHIIVLPCLYMVRENNRARENLLQRRLEPAQITRLRLPHLLGALQDIWDSSPHIPPKDLHIFGAKRYAY